MTFDTNGALLEGIRISSGNASFTYPPRSFISNDSSFSKISSRAEYLIMSSHVNNAVFSTDIGDPDLKFYWSRNEESVTRFDYDNFNRRWNTSPGGPPDKLGLFSNSPRLKTVVPNSNIESSTYDIYLNSPIRSITFNIDFVVNNAAFTNPSAGTVEISKETGELNFSDSDLNDQRYSGLSVYSTRQSFFDRLKTKGVLGVTPEVSDGVYDIFMNPRPYKLQIPRIRIGFRNYLSPIQVTNESSLGSPSQGTFHWSVDTGKIRFSTADLVLYPNEKIYYDGVFINGFSLNRVDLGSTNSYWPTRSFSVSEFQNNTISDRFYVFATKNGSRYYFSVIIVDSANLPSEGPSSGYVYLDKTRGYVYLSHEDVSSFGSSISYVDGFALIENGVSVQFYRSGVNSSGYPVEPDFVIGYQVSKQYITDGIQQSPFIMLPIVPMVDSTLSFSVESGSDTTGSFTGILVDSTDPSKLGYGYSFDLENRKISFSNRKTDTITLSKNSSQIKLNDPMILESGFSVVKNGSSIKPSIDFDFNSTSGLLEFIEPVGENNANNITGMFGEFILPNTFRNDSEIFSQNHIGQFLFVSVGDNAGLYEIKSVNGKSLIVDSSFSTSISGTADIRFNVEVIADRFWQDFSPPYKKFSLYRINSSAIVVRFIGLYDDPFTVHDQTEFSVLSSTSQVNLVTPAAPNDTFLVNYTSLDSTDNGVTTNPTKRVEYAAFKIRQETAVTKSGSSKVEFNPDGKTVDVAHPMKVYVDGVTQSSNSFSFTAPNIIILSTKLSNEQVTVDYWIREAIGGETNFNLLYTPIDLDAPQIIAGEKNSSFNYDQTSVLNPGGAFLLDGKEVMIIESVSYDSTLDITNVVFEEFPTVSTVASSKLQVTQKINGSYRVSETSFASAFSKNTNSFTINGNAPYTPNMVITVNEDPYLVSAVKYDLSKDKTTIMTAGPAKFSYVIPRITRTIRSVLSSGSDFNTIKNAHTGYPFTLVIGGNQHKILQPEIDYNVSEGGSFQLKEKLIFGDVLYALYVGRVSQPTGTKFDLNYAYGIAPDDKNGLKGQRLGVTYNLNAPDTFFFRVETVKSFMPEVISELKKSSSSGGSGPNTNSVSSPKTKDYGSSSLYFDEQHLHNLDVVISRLLKFYNDLANGYEDILADFDGRVVGAESGRFRFDGKLGSNRDSYDLVTNDIDDSVKLYDAVILTSFFEFSNSPVYAPMWQSNSKSRFFPTEKTVTVALNGNTGPGNIGKVLGNIGVEKLTSVGLCTTTRATSKFTTDVTGTVITVQENGNSSLLKPKFVTGQAINLYTNNGNLSLSTTISDVSDKKITINGISSITDGAVLQNVSDSNITLNHFYTPGRDLSINNDNGQVLNMSFPPPLDASQAQVSGNELINTTITYQNEDTAPKHIPSIDGLTLNDNSLAASPELSYENEVDLINRELVAIEGFGTVSLVSYDSSPTPLANQVTVLLLQMNVGDKILFLDGANSGITSTVTFVSQFSGYSICTVLNEINTTVVPSNVLRTISNTPVLSSIISKEVKILSSNSYSPTVSGVLGVVDCELTAVSKIMQSLGSVVVSSRGSMSGTTLTDLTKNFVDLNVQTSNYIVVPTGLNIGLYKISSISANSITVNTTSPYISFPSSIISDYLIIQPWSFLSSKEFDFMNPFIQSTLSWTTATKLWSSSWSSSGVTLRKQGLNLRKNDVSKFTKQIEGLLGKDDRIYDNRYLWISSRIDKKNGTLVKKSQAITKRAEATVKLLEDQQRLLIANLL